ncbi:MAG: glycosyltransferase family 2 protein [Planctomycetota bacterium]|jgi:glycosyltransferase involved in cell wall biosynthesis
MSESITVSACLIVRDEEKRLAGCLDSLRAIVDEIVVVDTGSKDRSREIALEGGAKVFDFEWKDDFSAARNASLEYATGDWILVLDADERLVWERYDEFRKPLNDPEKLGFLVTLVNLYEERSSAVLLLRLFRNRKEIRYSGLIHERIDPSLRRLATNMKRSVGIHPARVFHSGYLEEIKAEKKKDSRDIHLLNEQIRLDPSDPFHWYKFAVHPYARADCSEQVIEALNKAWALILDQDPQGSRYSYSPEVAALLMLSAFGRRNYEEAHAVAAEAAQFTYPSPNLDYTLGLSHLAAFELDEAAVRFEKALDWEGKVLTFAPFEGVTDHLSLNALSEVRYLQGMKQESARLFRKAAIYCETELANTFHGSPQAVKEYGDPSWSLRLLTHAVTVDETDPALWKRGGELLTALGLDEKAKVWIDRAAGLDRRRPNRKTERRPRDPRIKSH